MVQLGIRQIQIRLPKFRARTRRDDSDGAGDRLSSSFWQDERSGAPRTARRPRSRFGRPFAHRFGNGGFSTLGGCLALLAALAGVGLFELMAHIHKLAETQVALDRCTGEFALNLRAASVSMEESYQRIAIERKAAQAVCATLYGCPAAETALIAALTIEASLQQIVKVYWTTKESEWKDELANHCNLGRHLLGNGITGGEFPPFNYPIVDPALGINGTEEIGVLLDPMDDIKLHIEENQHSSDLTSEAVAARMGPANWGVRWTE
jgi:hypothetical protein